ncbi:DUF2512 family protein [Planococcus salinus]|uniref:DUF2512 family protein n=1 Tax=Planococcus salinus TaxID=1848460 RepID=A0A3M8P7A6_9BACL|nr:DUF2512 family protein [Planococcus salinus]RNF39553.1 DUF2512 family protein [Planococcus salinus]
MRHLIAFLIKFVMIAAVLLIVLTWIFDVSFVDTLLISLALSAVAYMMGDLLIFLNAGKPSDQTTRNSIATFSDFLLAFLVIWFVGQLLTGDMAQMVAPALISSLVIAAGEWFFHLYMDQKVMPEYNEYKSAK